MSLLLTNGKLALLRSMLEIADDGKLQLALDTWLEQVGGKIVPSSSVAAAAAALEAKSGGGAKSAPAKSAAIVVSAPSKSAPSKAAPSKPAPAPSNSASAKSVEDTKPASAAIVVSAPSNSASSNSASASSNSATSAAEQSSLKQRAFQLAAKLAYLFGFSAYALKILVQGRIQWLLAHGETESSIEEMLKARWEHTDMPPSMTAGTESGDDTDIIRRVTKARLQAMRRVYWYGCNLESPQGIQNVPEVCKTAWLKVLQGISRKLPFTPPGTEPLPSVSELGTLISHLMKK